MAHAASRHPRDLTEQQWDLIARFLPKLPRRQDGRGRHWRENRPVLNGILWILRTGALRADMPALYPSYQTCPAVSAVGPRRRVAYCPRVHVCELRNDATAGAGWDFQIFEGLELLVSRRCNSEQHARRVAEMAKGDYLRQEYVAIEKGGD
jgi:transposase